MREHTSRYGFAHRLVAAAALVIALLSMGLGAPSYADDAVQGTVNAGNGWVLTYESASGSATITGVSSVGSGKLSIPATAGGVPVTKLGVGAFKGASVASVNIPSSVEGVSAQCFRDCTSLSDVTFEGDTTGYIGPYSFAGCTSLKTFAVPVLTAYSKDAAGNTENYRMGNNCFLDCTNLEKVEFLSNGGGTQNYFTTYSVPVMESNHFGNCDKLRTFVFFCERSTFNRWLDTPEGTNWYYTVDFYSSEADAADYSKRVASITCLEKTALSDVIAGTVDAGSVYRTTGSIPALPSGKMWGVSDRGRQADNWGLFNSYSVYPVDADDLDYAWATSPEIAKVTDLGWQDTYWAYEHAVFSLNKAGTAVPGLDGIVVHSADGSVLDSNKYTLEYGERIMGAGGIYTDDYKTVSAVNSAGQYRVRAVASGSNAHSGSSTDYVEFEVIPYALKATSYATVHDAVYAIAGGHAGRASYSVVAPTSSWQYALIGAGLAAAGNGVLVSAGKDSISDVALRAIVANGAESVLALGGGVQLSKSVLDQVQAQSLFSRGGGVTSMTASSVQDMAVQAYNNILRYGSSRFANVAAWGTSAIVMSPNQVFNTASVAEYAFAKKAPVFFTNANGSLPSAVSSILSSGAFNEVVVAGPASAVPDSTLSQISGFSGVTATRLLDSTVSSGEANRAFNAAVASGLGLDAGKAVVASMSDPFNAILGAQVAVDNGAQLFTCASTADGKAIQAAIDAAGTQEAWLIGSFDATDPKLADRVASEATASPMSTALGNGDTFEQGSLLYGISGSGKVAFQKALDTAATSVVVPASVSYAGASYSVASMAAGAFSGCAALKTVKVSSKAITSIAASAFEGLANLQSVSYDAAISSIGKNAFLGCAALASLNANVQKAGKVGAAAFKNCKKLKKVAFTSSKLNAIPANAFSGCAALQSAQFNSTKVKSIGANAFSNCKKLKTITLKTTALTSSKVGKNAFSGIANKAKVKVPKSKVKSYMTILKAKGLPKKAKVIAG